MPVCLVLMSNLLPPLNGVTDQKHLDQKVLRPYVRNNVYLNKYKVKDNQDNMIAT